MQQKSIQLGLQSVLENIKKALSISKLTQRTQLVAASKTKSIEELMEAYNAGQRHFGENYVDEIVQKHDKMPSDVQWHFIGHLQSNKVNKVIVPTLYMIETVDSVKLATKIQTFCKKIDRNLKVLVQIKTSDEDSKSGISPEESLELIQFIRDNCPNIQFSGIMTIGLKADLQVFQQMYQLKQHICEKLNLDPETLEVSMGMSNDYEVAISQGATIVRVGSTIFGARNYPPKKNSTEIKQDEKEQIQQKQ